MRRGADAGAQFKSLHDSESSPVQQFTGSTYLLESLESYRQRYGFKVYAYVLMSNHVHLLLETGGSAIIPDHASLQLPVHTYKAVYKSSVINFSSAAKHSSALLDTRYQMLVREWCATPDFLDTKLDDNSLGIVSGP